MATFTNSVRVHLSAASKNGASTEAMQLMAIRRDLESLGEIAQAGIQKIDGAHQVVQAIYYDVRSAKAAKEHFGDACNFGPQEGSRSVLLQKDVFKNLQLAEIANVECKQSGAFEVEFFDTRMAAQVAGMAAFASASEVEEVSTCESLDELEDGQHSVSTDAESIEPMSVACAACESPASRDSSEPRRINDLRMSQLRWDDLAAGREWRTSLLLRGLPRSLCQPGRLEALLQASGLGDSVSSIRVPRSMCSRSVGHAIITASAVKEVPKVAKFFHGKQFGNSMPIAVSFASTQSGRATTRDAIAVVSSAATPVASIGVRKPKLISLSSCLDFGDSSDRTSMGSPRSSQSTSGNDCCSIWAPASDLTFPPGLRPPPGLDCASAASPLHHGTLAAVHA